MDSPNSVRSSNEDHQPRLKFMCSFDGSILPRPQDGKLRYIGGETRIVSVARDISFDELTVKMNELFDGANVLKYQQRDQGLDALVSVVNDDDVTNMMEEYEKLGSGDGFTCLRIFLFSSIEQDDPIHYVDRDERDNERRYVDDLNSLNDSPDFGKLPTGLDDQLIEQYYNQLSLDGNAHNQRNFDTPMPPVNLQPMRIPHHQSFSQRYSEMESPWSPGYFPNSPSSSRYHGPYGDQMDKGFDRVPPEGYFRQQNVSHQPQYDQQSPLPDNVVWLPPTPNSGDKTGFPGNILRGNGPRYIRHVPEFGNEFIHDQAMATGFPNAYGTENLYHAPSPGHVPANALWRNGQSPMHGHPSYEASGAPQQENGTYNLGYIRTTMESSPRLPVGVENQNQQHIPTEPVQYMPTPVQFMHDPVQFTPVPIRVTPEPIHFTPEAVQLSPEAVQMTPDLPNSLILVDPVTRTDPASTLVDDRVLPENTLSTEARNSSSCRKDGLGRENMDSPSKQIIGDMNSDQDNSPAPKNEKLVVDGLSHVPQPLESLKKSELEGAEEVKDLAQENAASAAWVDVQVKEDAVQELDALEGYRAVSTITIPTHQYQDLEKFIIPLEEIEVAIGVRKRIGDGGFGIVYKAQLSERWQNRIVAIKKHDPKGYQGKNEFRNEVEMLFRFHHQNIIPFIGYYDEGDHMIIVSEYAANGSLDYYLRDPEKRSSLKWIQRLEICLGAAKGLNYLHSGLGDDNRVIHRDIKSANILLDDNLEAKICDFGLSRSGPRNQPKTQIYTKAAGTDFYMDPIYRESGILRKESDVYSFGVVLFEMLSGMPAYYGRKIGTDNPETLISLVRRLYDGGLHKLIDPVMKDQLDPRSFDKFKELALDCISYNIKERPTMETVIESIEDALNYQLSQTRRNYATGQEQFGL